MYDVIRSLDPALVMLARIQKQSFLEDPPGQLSEPSEAFKNSFNNLDGSTTSEHPLLTE
ncbi:hypothetical protein [Nonomuraea wenchangensis]|uniref:hypothetical protein n=1 Tax=Nonomuraea wenchangensis TaxID=568860 RepID=UPI0015A733D4|nr:hypothetical protein [Nonomuraea wenchangensis]